MYFFAALLGAVAGSFLNVVALRSNVSSLDGRSKCPACNHTLSWYELIPIFSYIFLLGKCRNCKTKLSSRYLVAEIISAIAFLCLFLVISNPITAFLYALLLQISIILVLYDYTHLILPDFFLNSATIISLLLWTYIAVNGGTFLSYVQFLLMGILLVAGPLWLLYFISKETWLGFGDVRLGIIIGILLGPKLGLTALIVSYWIGAVVMLSVLALQKIWKGTLNNKSLIPFGPFLLFAMWLVILLKIDIIDIYLWIINLFTF